VRLYEQCLEEIMGYATWSKEREELVAFWVRKVQVIGENGTGRGHVFSFPNFHPA
jgi:hypothetical protein